MQIKNIKTLLFLILFMLSTQVYADPMLVLDMRNVPALPRNFRTTSDPVPTNINTLGLAELHIAGGAQFSKLALQKILQKLRTKHLTIIDLRQESHGFLDGNAISWYGPRDDANAGMTDSQIEKTQEELLHGLELQEFAKAYVVLKKSPTGQITERKPVEFSVHGVSSEAELVTLSHLNYGRIYVQDFHAPSDKEVDRFIQLVKELPRDHWIYFHCHAGIGRTTTFMVMYDMMRNAKKVSFEDILARQLALGGKDLAELPEPASFKYKPAAERLDFLKRFYQYAQENKNGFNTLWTKWNERE